MLDKFDLTNASKEVISLQRASFETKWNNLHIIRTVASIISFVLVIIACITNPAETLSPPH